MYLREYLEGVTEVRDRGGFGSRRRTQTPLERGWSGAKAAGRLFQEPHAKTAAGMESSVGLI